MDQIELSLTLKAQKMLQTSEIVIRLILINKTINIHRGRSWVSLKDSRQP